MSAISAPQAPITGSPSVAADTSRLATKANLDKAAAQFEALKEAGALKAELIVL